MLINTGKYHFNTYPAKVLKKKDIVNTYIHKDKEL